MLEISKEVFDEGLEETLKEFEEYLDTTGIVVKGTSYHYELMSLARKTYRYGVMTALRYAEIVGLGDKK